MTTQLNWPPLPMPISVRSRQQATASSTPETPQSLSVQALSEAPNPRTLAALVAKDYLRMIDVPHRLETSSEGLMHLYVEELGGYLACCALPAGANKCSIPDIDRDNRKGYLFIELCMPYHQAHILGFVPSVNVSELPLSYLRPLSCFVEALESASTRAATTAKIHLTAWAQGLVPGWLNPPEISQRANTSSRFHPAWAMRSYQLPSTNGLYEQDAADQGDSSLVQSLSALDPIAALIKIVESTEDDILRWQAAEQLAEQGIRHPQVPIIKVKALTDELGGLPVGLLIGMIAKSNGTFLIGCWLYGLGDQSALPEGLVLQGVEEPRTKEQGVEKAKVFCELTPTAQGEPLEYLFTAEAGDCFSLKVHYQGQTAINTFVAPRQD